MKDTVLITNGRGIFKRIPKGKKLPVRWQVAKDQPVDPAIVERDRKEAVVAKLEAAGIPFDGRSATDKLEKLLEAGLVEEE